MSETVLQAHENGGASLDKVTHKKRKKEKKTNSTKFFVTFFGLLPNFKKELQLHFLIYIFSSPLQYQWGSLSLHLFRELL